MKRTNQLLFRFWSLLLPVVVSGCLCARASGQTTFAQFTQDNANEAFSFSNANKTFDGTNTGSFTFLAAGAPVGPQMTTITLTSSAMTQASTSGPFLFQPMDGTMNTLSFTRVSDSANLLTLTFTGRFSGFDGDNSASLSGDSSGGNTVFYTSDFLNFSGTTQRTFGLTAGPDPDYSQGLNGFLNDFATDLGGSFAAAGGPSAAVPEPSTWLIGALIAGSLPLFARRRKGA